MREWLKESLSDLGMSQSELARRTGLSTDVISRVMLGKRKLGADELSVIAKALGRSPPLTDPTQAASLVRYVTVQGDVEGGIWADVTYSDFEPYEIPIVADPRWPKEALYALRVRGESINRLAKDGDYILALSVEAAPRHFQEGDWVVVERSRGDLRETTVKRVGGKPDAWLLYPDSTDPRWQDPVPLNGEGGDGVRVVAFVLDFIRPATRL